VAAPAGPVQPATGLLDLPGALLAQVLQLLKGHAGLKAALCSTRVLQACPGKCCLMPHAAAGTACSACGCILCTAMQRQTPC
jgi:hypothetical protein